MPAFIYPTLAEAKELHKRLIDEFGGTHGLREAGRLEAAVLRPQTGYYETLAENAAALMESLANNHAFLDGNKRISFAVADTFLRLNGCYLEMEPLDAFRFITSSMSKGEFASTRSATGYPPISSPFENAHARPSTVWKRTA